MNDDEVIAEEAVDGFEQAGRFRRRLFVGEKYRLRLDCLSVGDAVELTFFVNDEPVMSTT